MQIFVRTLLSKTVTIDVESTETISSLLAKLELHHGCEGDAADGQRLIFGGKQLENDKTVAEYEIQKGAMRAWTSELSTAGKRSAATATS